MGSREYPDRPVVGIGAVVVQDGKVLLVKRRYAPLAGEWSLPGGGVEVGETLEACVVREMREETGLDVEVGPVIEVFDRITQDADGRVQYHYVLVDYLCWPLAGELVPASDVADAAWVDPGDIAGYHITAKATSVIERALEMAATAPWSARAVFAGASPSARATADTPADRSTAGRADSPNDAGERNV
jgi:8-oxo-dGTP diphosphatase